MKYIIKETQLRKIIQNKIMEVLNEEKWHDEDEEDTNGIIPRNPEAYWRPISKEQEIESDWEDIEHYLNRGYPVNYPGEGEPEENPNINRVSSMDDIDIESAWAQYDRDKADEKYLSDNPRHGKYNGKFSKNRYDLEGAEFISNRQPLHRKGSLNRAMGESLNRKINRIVKESVKRVLKEHSIGGILSRIYGNIQCRLEDEKKNYELDGVEITEEDVQNVVSLLQQGMPIDDAISDVLSGIRDVLSQG